ncbi:HEAT repeat domain-containing protein [Flavobacterium difficile]|uniref:HEAT repeat domain-containing protein n=1 Tax=Flavobacterium difficile TaxID=2709659 RepID=A0ABX0I6Y3_9FLAO|nr:HEAT repeat domain-containing protein [Flavobacterium difficile]NHM02456.1 HEAT repeat domain-containing protein [Flavobacterium difficile]
MIYNKLLISFFLISFSAESIYFFLLYFFIPLIVLFVILIIFSLLYTRYSADKNEHNLEVIENDTNSFLTDLIFSDYTSIEMKEKISAFKKQYKLNANLKKYILNKIIHIKENLNETNEHTILLIYKYFGFDEISNRLINSSSWYSKSQALYQYQNIGYKIKTGYVKKLLDSKNSSLRSNAIIALISLSDEKFDVLDNYKYNISKADEVKILDIIYRKKSTVPKNINNWLQSKNDSIVIIAIKLIVRFRYKHDISLEQIAYLLTSENYKVRKEAILAVRELVMFEANDILMQHFKTETNLRNKISIIKTLNTIGTTENITFLSILLKKEENLELDLKLEIVNFINKTNASFFNSYTFEDETKNIELQKMIAHSNCPYLN